MYSSPGSSFVDGLLGHFAERPGAVAIEDGELRLTYAELDTASAGVAAGLRAAGCEQGEVVGICLPRSWRAVVAMVGAIRAGAAYVPIGAEQPPLRKRGLLELAEASLVLTEAGLEGSLPDSVRRLDVAALADSGAEPDAVAIDPGQLAYVLFTSGSTGEPKGVEITHANLVHLFGTGSDLLPVAGDKVLGVAPIEFDIGALETWGALVAGARLVLVPAGRPDPRAVGELIAARGVSFAFFAAGFFAQVVRAALPQLGGMRLIATGGDVMAPSAAAALREAHPGVRLLNGYGPTETTIVSSGFEVGAVDGTPLPIGKPLRGYSYHVLDERRRPVAPGEPGELWIGGEGVARGYRGDPELTAKRFVPDPFGGSEGARLYNSGDVVREREDGEYEFLGRGDDQVKISGHRIEPGEVEQCLGTHPAVAQAAVVAREDVPGHKRLVAYASLRDGAAAGREQLRHHLGERLPPYMLPAAIVLLDELPLTERGKLDRAALPAPPRALAGAELAAGEDGDAVAELFAELLGLDAVGPDDEFGALGGDSLLTIQLVGRIRDRLGVDADVATVFEARTPRRIAAALAAAGANPRPPLRQRADRSRPAPATFAQRRAWLFERMNPSSLSFQFAALVHLDGELDEAALRGALGDLMARHPVFRTAVAERDGEPVQIVHDDLPLPLDVVDLPGEDGVEWARLVRRVVRTRIELERAPLVRWTLVRRGPGRHTLIDVEHHAAHDGWSFPLVLSELAELYSARVEGREPELAALPVDLGDLAAWERELLSPEVESRQLDYWRRTLDPEPALLELPEARPRPPRESFAGSSVRRRMAPELAAAVRDLARAENATGFTAGLAAFAVLLGRVAGAEAVQIGTGLANRSDPAAEPLVGMTVGTAALRIDLSGDPSVRELLRRARAAVLDAIANADVPFERVVETLAPRRQATRSPLIQTMFSFDDAPAAPRRWAGLAEKVVQTIPNGTAKADLNVIGVDHGEGEPFFIWEHSDLLGDATVDRLAGHHLELLAQFAADPEARLSSLRLPGEEELGALAAWAAAAGEFDREASLPELVERQALARPVAVRLSDGAARLTYAELLARARRLAGALRERGAGPGEVVAVLLPRSLESAVAPLGVLIAGAAYVPLDPDHPPARIARALADAGATLALTAPALAATLPPGVEALDAAALAREGEPLEGRAGGPEDLAYVMYTSGSTGEPKGVEVTHRNVARLVDDPGFAELGPGTVMLHAASPAFDATTLELWGPLANGGTVAVLAERPSPDAIATAVAAHGVTTMWLTAGLFHELVDRRPDCLGRVRHLLAGGDVLSPHHVVRALAALPPEGRLTNGYGPTETTTFALTHELRPGDPIESSVPLGRPIQATSAEVLDSAGQPAPVGVPGELWIGGEGVARGYRGDPELTAERFVADSSVPGGRRYRSGDRARRRPDGTLEFLGRLDRQVKVRGVRVEPAEIERALRDHAGVRDAAVLPYEPTPGDRGLAAYVVPEPGAELDRAHLREHAASALPAAMVPSAWVELGQLPLNANGKLDRDRLPAPGQEHLARAASGDHEPRDEAERRVVAIFERVLVVGDVGAEEDFFALGGHSLLAVGLFAELEREGGRRLPLATIFEAPTPRALAALLATAVPDSGWDNLVALKPGGTRPPLFAVTAGDGNVVGFGPLARSLPADQPLYALQPSGLDGRRTLDRGIEAMASACVAEIQTVQPHGPYLLAGRCNGATVAFEIAQQLRRAGEEVALLAALDSNPPKAGPAELAPGVANDAFAEIAWLRARDRGEAVPDREGPGGRAALVAWLREPLAAGVSRYAHDVWLWREDLQRKWPDPLGADSAEFARWTWERGIVETFEPGLLLPVPAANCRAPGGIRWDAAIGAVWDGSGDPLAGWARLRSRLTEPVGPVNRYLLAVHRERPDLRSAFPDPLGADGAALLAWAWSSGLDEGLAPEILPRPPMRKVGRKGRSIATRAAQERLRRAVAGVDLGAERRDAARDDVLGAVERRLDRRLPRARGRLDRRLIRAAREARDAYRATPWPGRIVHFTSTEFADNPLFIPWPERAAGGVETVPLPVGHIEMMRDPGAALLAKALDDQITAALA